MTPLITELIAALCCLPGIGPKSAQRMALHLLERDRKGGEKLVDTLSVALDKVGHCQACRTLSETTLCPICANPGREEAVICVVETPADVLAIEQTATFRGRYFVLMGRLSPLDGIGPDELGIGLLLEKLQSGVVTELIIATSSTVEGQATAHYLAELAKGHAVEATRIAHGVPLGGELEYVDGHTLAQALATRRAVV